MTLFKASFKGVIGDTPEIFSYSRWFSDTSAGIATTEEVADALADSVANMLSQAVTAGPVATIGAGISEKVAWTGYDIREWNAGTDAQIGPPATRVLVDDIGTGLSGFGLPNQNALAVSIRYGTTGRRRWNRFYLPPMTVSVTNGGDHVHITVLQAISDWLTSEQTALLAGSPALSIVRYSPAAGAYNPAAATYIGSRIDTQRRRANAEAEVRVQDDFDQP